MWSKFDSESPLVWSFKERERERERESERERDREREREREVYFFLAEKFQI